MSHATDMTCRELVEVITDYLEGKLSKTDHARFEEHVASCPYCANYLDQMRATIDALGELPEESLPPAARNHLLEAFRGWSRSKEVP
jgi:anti-sigma factor RsiW